MEKIYRQLKSAIRKILPSFILDWYHFSLALLAALRYGFPSKKIKVIGITGTSGKSTVVEMASGIFQAAGYKVASLSSIKFRLGDQEQDNKLRMTLPGRFFIQKFLKKAVTEKCRFAFLEITSEGIKQFRHCFIDFQAVAITNLSPEHIESHGSFENYRQAKKKLFSACQNIHIINSDELELQSFLLLPARTKYLYGFKRVQADFKHQFIKAIEVVSDSQGLSFKVGHEQFHLKILGEFNIANALAAISIAGSQNISFENCRTGLESFSGVPGRMEQVMATPFKVFIDYAITPDALEKAYQTLVKNYKTSDNNLICVLGACGGGRDKWKRPVLGKIAAQYCQEIILTNEDPYDENPQSIIDNIESGFSSNSKFQAPSSKNVNYFKIIDRREAIAKALSLAKSGDVVIITGKGCEPSMCLAHGQQIPWDDCQVVKEEFNQLK